MFFVFFVVRFGIGTMKLLLVGHGRMGSLVEALAPEYGCTVAGIVDELNADDEAWPAADVAIDFTTAEALVRNLPRLAAAKMNVVIGTTGWQAHEEGMRQVVDRAEIGVVVSANFSLGVNLFVALAETAAKLMQPHGGYGAFIHEAHHAAKKDAPSGTALMLKAAMERVGYTHRIDVSSTRAGSIPGTHTIGFDGASESITLSHEARDRGAFARGALEAARWVQGRRGWFTMRDVIGM